MTTFKRLMLAAGFVLAVASSAWAQFVPSQTTLSGAITDPAATFMTVSSASGFNLTDSPVGVQKMALIDKELVSIRTVSGTLIGVTRGLGGTRGATHASGAVVTVSGAPAFRTDDSSAEARPTTGSCTSANETYLPIYNVQNGRRWNCIGSQWAVDNGVVWLPASDCGGTASSALQGAGGTSWGSSGFVGLTTEGTGGIQVTQVATTASAVNHIYQCQLNGIGAMGLNTAAVRQLGIIDATVVYGVLQTALPTQTSSGSLGYFNGFPVFTSIALPVPSASAISPLVNSVGPVRADSGFLSITPNNPVGQGVGLGTTMPFISTTTNTAGAFYSIKFSPASPFFMSTDSKLYLLSVQFVTGAALTTTNVAGVLIHYFWIPD